VSRAAALASLLIAMLGTASCTSAAPGGSGSRTGQAFSPAATVTAHPAPAPALAAGGSADLPDPRMRMLLGALVDLSGQPSSAASVAMREGAMGRPYDLQLTYYNWTDPFPDAGEQAMAAAGTTPVMAWYPPDKDLGSAWTLSQVTSAADDRWITRQARAIRAFGHRVFLRLMPEMNGNWYGYSGDPAAYVAAWRYVHEVFDRAGATNVTWVWCPNVNPGNWDSYYPGSAYVDVIGIDGFSDIAYTWQTFEQLFGGDFAHFAAFAPGKPQLVVETGTNSGAGVPGAGVGSAASFISGMRDYLKAVAGPEYRVIGVCWFDTDTNNGQNWRVDQTPQSWQAWLALARDPYFGGHGP
jgi:Glycosyl hydrolase family 26